MPADQDVKLAGLVSVELLLFNASMVMLSQNQKLQLPGISKLSEFLQALKRADFMCCQSVL